jgi:hypothetical protein
MNRHLSNIQTLKQFKFDGAVRGIYFAKFTSRTEEKDILLVRHGNTVYTLSFFLERPELNIVTDAVRDELISTVERGG